MHRSPGCVCPATRAGPLLLLLFLAGWDLFGTFVFTILFLQACAILSHTSSVTCLSFRCLHTSCFDSQLRSSLRSQLRPLRLYFSAACEHGR